MSYIWVKVKDKPGTQKCIDERDFDPDKYEHLTQEEEKNEKIRCEINLKDIIESKRAPGLTLEKTDRDMGKLTHNGKLDSGAVGDLLDKGLEGAKKRSSERNKQVGSSYHKRPNRIWKRKNKRK